MPTFSEIKRFLEMREPLQTDVLSAYFGEGAFLGPNAQLTLSDAGKLYTLRASFSWVCFQGTDCWKNFLKKACEILASISTEFLYCPSSPDVPIALINGRYLCYNEELVKLAGAVAQLPRAETALVLLKENTRLDLSTGLPSNGDIDAEPLFVCVTINLLEVIRKGEYEFQAYCGKQVDKQHI
jgi:hypothetical protein